jgi:hypothetical protein
VFDHWQGLGVEKNQWWVFDQMAGVEKKVLTGQKRVAGGRQWWELEWQAESERRLGQQMRPEWLQQ